jgi:hypothetical protein
LRIEQEMEEVKEVEEVEWQFKGTTDERRWTLMKARRRDRPLWRFTRAIVGNRREILRYAQDDGRYGAPIPQ